MPASSDEPSSSSLDLEPLAGDHRFNGQSLSGGENIGRLGGQARKPARGRSNNTGSSPRVKMVWSSVGPRPVANNV
jgi:hypothetical protein